MPAGPQMLQNLGLSGYAFAGADAGGHAGTPPPELLTNGSKYRPFALGARARSVGRQGDDAQAHCEDARRGGRTLGAAGEAQRSEPASVAILVGCLADQATKHFTSTI
jgi:hypothetical protein